MIGSIRGTLIDKSPPWIQVDCGGIGYEIEVPMSTYYHLPELQS
ncbi:OB-fold domain-containing protein, partial [Methylophilaceae bacterium]|nr:OB-fold domain-containing protein [Methylophilaceae bacterium]